MGNMENFLIRWQKLHYCLHCQKLFPQLLLVHFQEVHMVYHISKTGYSPICPLFICTLSLECKKGCKSIFHQYVNDFFIETDYDIILSLNCAVDQIVLKLSHGYLVKLTHTFIAIEFWCFAINADLCFYMSKELTHIWGIFLIPLSKRGKKIIEIH